MRTPDIAGQTPDGLRGLLTPGADFSGFKTPDLANLLRTPEMQAFLSPMQASPNFPVPDMPSAALPTMDRNLFASSFAPSSSSPFSNSFGAASSLSRNPPLSSDTVPSFSTATPSDKPFALADDPQSDSDVSYDPSDETNSKKRSRSFKAPSSARHVHNQRQQSDAASQCSSLDKSKRKGNTKEASGDWVVQHRRDLNRNAAARCRQRKLDRIQELNDLKSQLVGEATKAKQVLAELERELYGLQRLASEHSKGGCHIRAK
jgi:hypothetical protein